MEYLFTYNFVSACSKNNLYLTLIIYAYLPNVTSSPTDYSGGGWDRLVSGGRCQEWAHFFVIFLFSFNIFFTFLTPHLSNLRLYNPFTGFGGSRNDNSRVRDHTYMTSTKNVNFGDPPPPLSKAIQKSPQPPYHGRPFFRLPPPPLINVFYS